MARLLFDSLEDYGLYCAKSGRCSALANNEGFIQNEIEAFNVKSEIVMRLREAAYCIRSLHDGTFNGEQRETALKLASLIDVPKNPFSGD